MNEKLKGRSSQIIMGRFFLLLISIFSLCQPLKAATPDNPEDEKINEVDSLRSFSDNSAKIYITGGARLTVLENTITSPIIIVKDINKKEISGKKKKKLENKTEGRKNIKKNIPKHTQVSKFYFTNPHDKEFNHFDVGLSKAVVTTTQQIKLFSINKLFILNLVLLVSIYLVCFFKESTFFISIIGKKFQRPPPYFSMQLF